MKRGNQYLMMGRKLRTREPFRVDSATQRSIALKAAKALELRVTSREDGGGKYLIIPLP